VPEDREDRFGDLGREEPSAAERFADLDEGDMEAERRERERQAGGPPRPSGRYTWVVGIAALIVIAVGLLRVLGNSGEGLSGPSQGEKIPRFAVPLATADVEGDANIKQGPKDETVSNETPACEVRGAGIMNVCDLYADKPLVLILAADRADCGEELAAAADVSRAMPDVQFAATIASRSREDARELAEEAGVDFPVGFDKAPPVLFNLYRIAYCSTAFVEQGGTLSHFEANSALSEEELRVGAEELLAR
jgi:hypothetical protein